MKLHGVFKLLDVIPILHSVVFSTEKNRNFLLKSCTREESENQVTSTYFIKQTRLTFIRFIDLCKQVCNMIGLTEVVQNVIVFCMNTKLFKLVLESARLFKKTEYFVYLNA